MFGITTMMITITMIRTTAAIMDMATTAHKRRPITLLSTLNLAMLSLTIQLNDKLGELATGGTSFNLFYPCNQTNNRIIILILINSTVTTVTTTAKSKVILSLELVLREML